MTDKWVTTHHYSFRRMLAGCCCLMRPSRVMPASRVMMSDSDDKDIVVDYVTDLEGNLEYFDRWVPQSNAVRYKPGTTELELTNERAYFIYGGDLIDRFDGSLRLARRIVDLKKQYPDRVFFLAGNRDLNKVRFTSELSDDDMRRPYASIPGPHWDPKAPTLAQYLERLAAERGVDAQSLDTKAERLRYYLTHTLGCPGGFELRRRELGLLAAASAKPGAPIEPITDEQVVDSMVDDIRPRAPAEARMGVLPARECMGVLREYLQLAQLVVILGNTMWVHGALDAITIGIVPEDGTRFCAPAVPQPFRTVEGGVAAWANEMNALMQRGLLDHAARPHWDEERTSRGGELLLALQNRCSLSGRCIVALAYADGGCITSKGAAPQREYVKQQMAESAVHDSLLYEDWTSDPRDVTVAQWLLAGGIRRVCVGHKPSGDSPAICSASYTGVEIISADTTYADTTVMCRGQSLACVSIHGPSLDVNHARVYGTLVDGRRHDVTLPTLARAKPGAPPPRPKGGDLIVGRELEDGWWVKARFVPEDARQSGAEDGQLYLCCRGIGRKVEYRDDPCTNLPLD
jgi:hypothetical protein